MRKPVTRRFDGGGRAGAFLIAVAVVAACPNISLIAQTMPPQTQSTIAPAATAAAQSQTVEMTKVDRSGLEELGFGNSQWLYPLDAPKERLSLEPAYKSEKPVYYAATLGDSADNVFTLVIDESGGTGTGYDTLYLDADNDNRVDSEEERHAFTMSTVSNHVPLRITFEVETGGTRFPFSLSFEAFPYKDKRNPTEKVHATLRDSSYLVGKVAIDGKLRSIALADLNTNGRFNDCELEGFFTGDRFFIDLNDNDSFKDDRTGSEPGFPYGGITKIDRRWYSITATADGRRLTIAPAVAGVGLVKAPPMVARAFLRSATQPCNLDFSVGPAEAPSGSYELADLALTADHAGTTWYTSVRFPKGARPKVTVTDKQTVVLEGPGLPLLVRPTVTPAEGEAGLEIGLEAVGRSGERYNWPSGGARKPPHVEVRSTAGKAVFSATLGFG